MKSRTGALVSVAIVVVVLTSVAAPPSGALRRITIKELEDRIRGGWAGQIIGVSYGGPTEFQAMGQTYDKPIEWSPDKVSNALNQDDLYVEMTFAEVMDTKGLDATSEQYGEMFKDSKYSLWHANAAARRLLNTGIKAPLSGDPRNNPHANDIDFQIESDFIGLMAPGLPQEVNKYADRVGRVMGYGDGLYGGMFIGGMYAAAFFETDVRQVVEQGLAGIPAKSRYGLIIRDVLAWSAEYPDDWKKTWQRIEEKWNKDDTCFEGALRPGNIDASLNGAYVALGLIYGGKDFGKTLEVTTRAGQDSDCNPSSAAGILGVMLGYNNLPDAYKGGLPKLADAKFAFTNYSFDGICASTLERAKKVILSVGGKIDGKTITIPAQAPKPPALEQWNPGIPDMRIGFKDAAWTWKGAWKTHTGTGPGAKPPITGQATDGAGAEATVTFTGIGVVLIGPYSQAGGRADVYLDGQKAGEINAYIAAGTKDEGLWHTYGLTPGPHTLRLVTRHDADPRSTGKHLVVRSVITFRPAP